MTSKDVKSATRVLEIFELFAELKHPLRQKEIIDRLGYPQSSATTLLKAMTARGYLQYDIARRQYFPTIRLSNLGNWLRSLVDDTLLKVLRDLQFATSETTFAAVQNDVHVQYVKIVNSNQEIRFNVQEGSMRPLTDASAGWLLLSRLPPRDAERIVWQINAAAERDKRIDQKAFLAKIAALRDQDHCYAPNIPMLGGGSVVMLVNRHFRDIDMVIGVGAPVTRLDQNLDSIVARLRELVERYNSSGDETLTI